MTPTTFQTPELRDNLDNIIQAGAYGKKTAFCNAQNTGVLDYINNNLMYLWTNLVDEPTIDSKIATHNIDANAHEDIRKAINAKANKTEVADDIVAAVTEAKAYTDTEKANYLPLSGGTVNGTILAGVTEAMWRNNNNTSLVVNGGPTWNTASRVRLFGGESPESAGCFELSANTADNHCELIGYPHGELYWNGQHIATNNKLSMPSENFINVSITTNGQLYTAPTDGWLFCNGTSTEAGQYINIDKAICYSGFAQGTTPVLYPMRKGQSTLIYYAIPSITEAKFFYAQSAI